MDFKKYIKWNYTGFICGYCKYSDVYHSDEYDMKNTTIYCQPRKAFYSMKSVPDITTTYPCKKKRRKKK